MSITDIKEKIKHWGHVLERRDILTILVIILASSASFGLGRLSSLDENREPIAIVEKSNVYQPTVPVGGTSASVSATVVQSQGASLASGLYVASKNGKKYFYPWCSGAKAISPANLISFNSKDEAEKAGYTPAANCKGL